MSAEVAEAIRQTRRTLTEKTWVPRFPLGYGECCLVTAIPGWGPSGTARLRQAAGVGNLVAWNDRQTDVGAVLGMTLEALIAELCKGDS